MYLTIIIDVTTINIKIWPHKMCLDVVCYDLWDPGESAAHWRRWASMAPFVYFFIPVGDSSVCFFLSESDALNYSHIWHMLHWICGNTCQIWTGYLTKINSTWIIPKTKKLTMRNIAWFCNPQSRTGPVADWLATGTLSLTRINIKPSMHK